ncbi:MAG: phage shock protein PspC (stress-responsive transcriptional regulator) [Bacteroidia bacterium]|jgi:phage shock protein PspC (stress-responsive transcriptional regulator)
MNKIVTINIGGIAITIEEDAFDALRDYLRNIGNHFKNTENGDEIISDIELRVGEVLQSKLSEAKISINIGDVEEVAQTMGYPSDFEVEDAQPSAEPEKKSKEKKSTDSKEKSSSRKTRRLFRDVENQKVGGVCGGLAKYFDFDPMVLRILWVLSLLVFGFGFWIYIILWAILPGAKTAADKLEMMGKSPNIENIKNTIQDEAKATYQRIATPENRKTISNFFESVIAFLRRAFGVFFKLFAIIAFVGIIILLVTSLIGIIFNGHFFNVNSNVRFDGHVFDALVLGTGSWLFKIAFYLIFAIPLVYIGMHILPELLSVPKPTKPIKQSMISGWFIVIILAIVGFFYSARQYQSEGIATEITTVEIDSDTLIIRVDDIFVEEFNATKHSIRLDVIQSDDGLVEIKTQKSARGSDEATAKSSTAHIADAYRLSKNTLMLSEKVLLKGDGKAVAPTLSITVKVPIGHTVIFHESTKKVIHNIENLQNIYDPNMAGHSFYMSEAGFRCLDCKSQDKRSSTKSYNQGFNRLEVSGALKVAIIEGEKQDVEIPERMDGKKWVDAEIHNNTLYLKQKNGLVSDNQEIMVYIPVLKSIKLTGASSARVDASELEKAYVDIELKGASKIKFVDAKCDKISLEMSGASYASFSGETDLLLLEADGASNFDGSGLTAENVNLDMTGASQAIIIAISEVTGNMKGASNFKYQGNPTIKVDRSVGASIKQMD